MNPFYQNSIYTRNIWINKKYLIPKHLKNFIYDIHYNCYTRYHENMTSHFLYNNCMINEQDPIYLIMILLMYFNVMHFRSHYKEKMILIIEQTVIMCHYISINRTYYYGMLKYYAMVHYYFIHL